MIDLKYLKEIALANVSDPTTEYFYRYVCRWYSKTFHTPLHVVLTELSPSDVLIAYFEEGYETMDEDDRFLQMMKTVDPDFDDKEEESIQEFINMIEEEQENKRLAKAEKDKAKGFAIQDTPSLSGNATQKPSVANTSSQHKPEVPNIAEPVVRTFVDDTPDDESGDL